MPLRIVKLGGSLLDLPGLIPRFRGWLNRQAACTTVLVVGGGTLADQIRDRHRQQRLSDSEAHWLCVRAMRSQAAAVLGQLHDAEWAGPFARWSVKALDRERHPAPSLSVLDPWQFLRDEEPLLAARPLPESWDVTSDSIAARAAALADADELVLLKSATPPAQDLLQLAEIGYVDRYFPQAARGVAQLRFVNMRAVTSFE